MAKIDTLFLKRIKDRARVIFEVWGRKYLYSPYMGGFLKRTQGDFILLLTKVWQKNIYAVAAVFKHELAYLALIFGTSPKYVKLS